jgi:hypothetical protein
LALALAELTEEIAEWSGDFVRLIGDLRRPGMFDHDRHDSRAHMLHEIGETERRRIIELVGNCRRRGCRRDGVGRYALRRRVIAEEKATNRRG